jgi:GNAT superfamily N-acetyltransferase
MPALISPERPDSPDARALIDELQADLEPLYPPKSCHGYSVEKLIAQGVAFFVLRHESEPAGCGGVQFYGRDYGEIKRMYVRPRHRGLGLAWQMLNHLAGYARGRGASLLRLETGIYQPAAIGLYEGAGFKRIASFGAYREDPLSRYYEKRLDRDST